MSRPLRSTLGVVMIYAAACRGNTAAVEPEDGTPVPQGSPAVVADTVHLVLGGERKVDGGRLSLRLLERVSDSRCPADAICVWRGEARVRIEGQVGALTREAELRVANEADSLRVAGYRIVVAELHPYPGLHGQGTRPPIPWVVVRLARR